MRCVGWNKNSWMRLPEFRALTLAPQSSETQLIPCVPVANCLIKVIGSCQFLKTFYAQLESELSQLTDEDNELIVGGALNHSVDNADLITLLQHKFTRIINERGWVLTSWSSSATFAPCL